MRLEAAHLLGQLLPGPSLKTKMGLGRAPTHAWWGEWLFGNDALLSRVCWHLHGYMETRGSNQQNGTITSHEQPYKFLVLKGDQQH